MSSIESFLHDQIEKIAFFDISDNSNDCLLGKSLELPYEVGIVGMVGNELGRTQ